MHRVEGQSADSHLSPGSSNLPQEVNFKRTISRVCPIHSTPLFFFFRMFTQACQDRTHTVQPDEGNTHLNWWNLAKIEDLRGISVLYMSNPPSFRDEDLSKAQLFLVLMGATVIKYDASMKEPSNAMTSWLYQPLISFSLFRGRNLIFEVMKNR